MSNREILFKKIDAQKKQWESQVKDLQSKMANLEADSRTEYEKQMHHLNKILKDADKYVHELKKHSDKAWHDIEASANHSWHELTVSIDDAISKLKRHH